jgi:hypothetical protein
LALSDCTIGRLELLDIHSHNQTRDRPVAAAELRKPKAVNWPLPAARFSLVLDYQLRMEKPVPIWVVRGDDEPSAVDPPVLAVSIALRSTGNRGWLRFRGVSIDRLPVIARTGVDVEPADSPIFCDCIEKAWEYPGTGHRDTPRAVMAFKGASLARSFQTRSLDASADEIAEVRKSYPHMSEREHDLWFSREEPRGYEELYGYWIPGDAKDALLAIFLFGETQALDDALHALPPTA